jgi:hypothetical protein
MKKMIFVVLAVLSLGAFATEELVDVNGKKVMFTEIDPGGSKQKIDASNLPNGVYLEVREGFNGRQMPNSEKMVRAMFEAKGIKMADQMYGSSAYIQLHVTGSLNASAAEAGAESWIAGQAAVGAGIGGFAGALAGAGKAAAIGYVLGAAFIPADEKTAVGAYVVTNPFPDKNFLGMAITSSKDKDGMLGNNILFKYKMAEKDEEKATEDLVLRIMVEKWIAHSMINMPQATIASAN